MTRSRTLEDHLKFVFICTAHNAEDMSVIILEFVFICASHTAEDMSVIILKFVFILSHIMLKIRV